MLPDGDFITAQIRLVIACAILQVQKNKNSYYLTKQPPVIIGKRLIRLQFQDRQIILHMEDPDLQVRGRGSNAVSGQAGIGAVPSFHTAELQAHTEGVWTLMLWEWSSQS